MNDKSVFLVIFSTIKQLSKKGRGVLFVAIFILLISASAKGVVIFQKNSTTIPVAGGSFVEGIIGQPTAINPVISRNSADRDIAFLVYSSLKDLASDVRFNEETNEYVIRLYNDLQWSDGEPITTDDVVFTIETIQNPETGSPLAKNWSGVSVERISEIQLSFGLPAPFAFFENNIERLTILPQHIFGNIPAPNIRLSSFNLEPISSGPYKFKEFQQDRGGFINSYILTKNEKYHKNPPMIEEFEFRFFSEKEDLLRAFEVGDIDGFGSTSILDEPIRSTSEFSVNEIPMPRYYALFFNPRSSSPLNDIEVRRFLERSINKEALSKSVLRGKVSAINKPVGTGAERFVNHTIPPNSEHGTTTQPERLLEEEENLDIQILVPNTEMIKKTAEFIKKEWENAGANSISVVSLNPEEFMESVLRERAYEAVIFGHSMENPLDLFPFWHSSERFHPGLNLSLYNNEEVDEMLEKIRQTKNEVEREEIFIKAAEQIKNDAQAIFLYTAPYTYVQKNSLKGFSAKKPISNPQERFNSVTSWHTREARVINR